MKVLVLLFAFSSFVYGLTLDEILRLAYENSPILKEKVHKVSIAEHLMEGVKSSRFGKFSITGSYEHYSEETNLEFIDVKNGLLGMTFARDFYGFAVEYEAPLFTGFRIEKSLEKAEVSKQIAKLDVRISKDRLRYEITSLYLKILSLRRLREALKAHIASLRKLREKVYEGFKLGKRAQVELLKVNYQLEMAKANLERVNSSLESAKQKIRALVGVPGLRLADFQEVELPDIRDRLNSYEKAPQLSMAELYVKRAEKGVELERASYFPEVGFKALYSKRFAEGENFDFYKVALVVRYTLFDFGVRLNRVKMANDRLHIALENKRRVSLEIESGLKEVLNRLKALDSRIGALQKRLDFSKKVEEIERVKYEQGVSDIYDYLRAKAEKLSAESDYYGALYERELAKAYLIYLLGD